MSSLLQSTVPEFWVSNGTDDGMDPIWDLKKFCFLGGAYADRCFYPHLYFTKLLHNSFPTRGPTGEQARGADVQPTGDFESTVSGGQAILK